jgi:hypothetical protein
MSALLRSEDWLAVWLGFLILALVLAGVPVKTLSFRWAAPGTVAAAGASTGGAAVHTVLSGENRGRSLTIGIAFLLLAAAFNVVWTLGLAYLLFGGVLFPRPGIR